MGFLEQMSGNPEGISPQEKKVNPLETISDAVRMFEAKTDAYEKTELLEEIAVPGIEGCPDAVTRGDYIAMSLQMDAIQGDAVEGVAGNCGLLGVRNLIAISDTGLDVSEESITHYAIRKNLCCFDLKAHPLDRGGTTASGREQLLKEYGIETQRWESDKIEVSKERLADALDHGRRGIVALSNGILRDKAEGLSVSADGQIRSNHVITLLSAVRSKATGEVKGFMICDSASGGARFEYVDADKLMKAYDVKNGTIHITTRSMERGNG